MYQKNEFFCIGISPHLSELNVAICKSSNWQHIYKDWRLLNILGANWQLFRLERIAKCSYFILSTQNIKFYWFVMKIKKFLLPIWWYNRGSFSLGNNYFGVFILNGLILYALCWPVGMHGDMLSPPIGKYLLQTVHLTMHGAYWILKCPNLYNTYPVHRIITPVIINISIINMS